MNVFIALKETHFLFLLNLCPIVIRVFRGVATGTLPSLPYLVIVPRIPVLVSLVRPTGIIIISILYLVIAQAVPYIHYSSSWWLHWYPSVITVLSLLVGFPGTLVSLQYLVLL